MTDEIKVAENEIGDDADGREMSATSDETAVVERVSTAPQNPVLYTPTVAIVGRPNVGKSRLFNRMTGTRTAIVEGTPGVTRDRNYGGLEWYGKPFTLVDTGGFEPTAADILMTKMREQAQLAMDEADAIIVLFDGQTGPTATDWDIVDMLRPFNKPIHYAVNKIDGPRHEGLISDFCELGVEHLFPISAEHGLGVDDLIDKLTEWFPTADELAEARGDESGTVRLAVVGRPNVGKSTLVNKMLGDERLLVSSIPGTTRDAIDTHLERNGKRYLLIDTAGVRRRQRISLALEKYSVVRSFKAIDRAEVVLFMLDGIEGPTDQDRRLLALVHEKGRALILLVNKWDAIEKTHKTADEYTKALRREMPWLNHVPVTYISALTGQRVHRVLDEAHRVRAEWQKRISTSQLNQFLEDAVGRRQPPVHRNRRLKFFYATQVRSAPPGFLIMCNYPKAIPTHYRRYLHNQLREAYGFEGTPIRLFFKQRTRRDLNTG